MCKIGVVGSLNMDLVATVDRFPQPGETLLGNDFGTFPGGKGANQAVAVARLGAEVRLFGKVGDDLFGQQLIVNLKQNGVRAEGVASEAGVPTGSALIEVEASGENHIIVIPGANQLVDEAFIRLQLADLLENDLVLFQLEIPVEAILFTMKQLKAAGKLIVLDPAPAKPISREMLAQVDFITPNETELALLTGRPIHSASDLQPAAQQLLEAGAGNVIVKAGKNGAFAFWGTESVHVPGFTVNAIDTTGAGDSFNAGLAVGLAQGYSVVESIRLANAVGALATTAKGAQSAMPSYAQVQALLAQSQDGNSIR